MGRLEKKCLMGSLLTHAALVGALLFGAAFIKPKAPEVPPQANILHLIKLPDKLTDGLTQMGGGGAATPPPPQPVQEQQAPTPAPVPAPPEVRAEPPPPRVVETPKPEPRPEPVKKPEPKPEPIKKPEPVKKPKPEPPKPKIEVNLKPVRIKTDEAKKKRAAELKAQQQAAKAAEDLRRKQVMANLNKNISRLENNLSESSTVSVSVQGPSTGNGWGGSGATLVNYAQWVKEIYDRNWIVPDAVTSDQGIVRVEIVVQRNGDARGRIVKSSGDALLDRTVQGALDRVRNIGYPFPEGTTEKSRTFTINFNLKSRRQAG